jgi:ribosomal-protein-alanine N-acetyltransferase
VRPAAPGDALALAALDGLVNPSPWTQSQFAGACSGHADGMERALVAECGGQPEGFVVYSGVLDEVCIHNIAVRPALQGRGLGRLLLTAVLARARDDGARRCFLEVRASNLAARALYDRLGFRPDGVRKNYYPTAAGREDAVLMSMQLQERER